MIDPLYLWVISDMIFDEDDRMDEVQNYDDLQIANTGEVYLYKQTSGDPSQLFGSRTVV